MTPVVRPMTVDDIAAVMAIEAEGYEPTLKASGYRHEVEANPLAAYLVLEDAGEIVGHAGFWLLVDEAHVSIIVIHPDRRGQGLGSLVLAHLLSQADARGARLATLEVRRSNHAAQALYARFGFAEVGVRRRYSRDGEDALIMTTPPFDEQARATWARLAAPSGAPTGR